MDIDCENFVIIGRCLLCRCDGFLLLNLIAGCRKTLQSCRRDSWNTFLFNCLIQVPPIQLQVHWGLCSRLNQYPHQDQCLLVSLPLYEPCYRLNRYPSHPVASRISDGGFPFEDTTAIRQIRSEGLLRRGIPVILAFLPLFFQTPLVLFFLGLIGFLWILDVKIVIPVTLAGIAILVLTIFTTGVQIF